LYSFAKYKTSIQRFSSDNERVQRLPSEQGTQNNAKQPHDISIKGTLGYKSKETLRGVFCKPP